MPLFTSRPRPAGASDPESGYVLLAVIFMTFMVLLSLAVAAPKIATSIQREKEIETVHRGEQYKRALQLYYRKFGRYPTTIDQLVNTNNIRFLRKRYKDPLTGKDDWKLVRFGQAHVRPLGFFGQPLGAGAMGGLAGASIISGSMYAPMPATNPDGTPASTDATTALGAPASQSATGTGTGPSMAGNPGGFGSAPNPGFGSTGSSGFGSTTSTGFGSSTGGFGSNTGMGSNPSTGFGSPTSSGVGGSNSPFSTGGGAGTTFGGSGFIVGVTLPVDKPSLLDYKKQTRYNRWEFNYDPMEDQMKQVAGAGGGPNNLNGNGTTNMPGVGNPNMPGMGSPFGSNTGGTSSPFGGTGTSGSSPFGGTGTSGSGPSFGGVSSGSGSNTGNSGSSDGGSSSGGTNGGSSGTQQPQPQ